MKQSDIRAMLAKRMLAYALGAIVALSLAPVLAFATTGGDCLKKVW